MAARGKKSLIVIKQLQGTEKVMKVVQAFIKGRIELRNLRTVQGKNISGSAKGPAATAERKLVEEVSSFKAVSVSFLAPISCVSYATNSHLKTPGS